MATGEGHIYAAVDTYLRRCFAHQVRPRVSDLAHRLHVSRDTLSRSFRRASGVTLLAYFQREQIAKAKRLLIETDTSVETIARRAAFATERSFRRTFRRIVGMTPAFFRHNHK